MRTTNHAQPGKTYRWSFFRAGGFDQVRFKTGQDLLNIDQLDQKLWVALACPVSGLHFDRKTLNLIDTDKDGRIRVPELIAAVKWAGSLLKDPDVLVKHPSALPLDIINDSVPEGALILKSARKVLTVLGKKDATSISVTDTDDTSKILAQTAFNGDGVIVEDSASDEATKAAIRDIIACLGPVADCSGKPGVDQAKVDLFFGEAKSYADWVQKSANNPAILPLGDATADADAAIKAVAPKVEDYFARCRLAEFDPRASNALNRDEKEYAVIGAKDLTSEHRDIAALPLARVEPHRPLPLLDGVNPAWATTLANLHAKAVKPLLGDKSTLTLQDWNLLVSKLAEYNAWISSKPKTTVEKLGMARIRELLASRIKDNLAALIARDKAEEQEVKAIAAVDKLVRYTRDLLPLCRNFVNFEEFYVGDGMAIFQAGRLYLDQRACDLTLPVEDVAKHATLAGLAGCYLAYCDCVRKGTGEKMQIVAAFTNGDSDNLMVGRNGVFYDRNGRDWDATITKIIENPISLRQAFWAPYKKFVRMIEAQIAKRAAAAEAASTQKLEAAATTAATPEKLKEVAPKKVDVGTVAAIGVAFGAIGTFFATLLAYVTGLMKLGPLAVAGALIAVVLLISGPSMILAYIKLRKRNLGPIMDANGWAVNANARISVPLGAALTHMAKLPPGSHRELFDPYAEKKSPWPIIIILALVLYIAFSILNSKGKIYQWTDGWIGKQPQTEAVQKPAEEKP